MQCKVREPASKISCRFLNVLFPTRHDILVGYVALSYCLGLRIRWFFVPLYFPRVRYFFFICVKGTYAKTSIQAQFREIV